MSAVPPFMGKSLMGKSPLALCGWDQLNLVPGAGLEPARLAAGDFELAFEGVCLGKWGEAERRLRQVKVIVNQWVSVV